MTILAIDTSTLCSTVALVDGDRAIERSAAATRAADLLVLIDKVCREWGVSPRTLDAVAIGAGPGSFTALRIGMATAKGIAFAAHRPLWSVSSLATLAAQMIGHWRGPEPVIAPAEVIVGVLGARRGEVYAGCYSAESHALVGAEHVLPPGELEAWATSIARGASLCFAGDALTVHAGLAPLAARWLTTNPSARSVAELALAGPRVDVLTSGRPSYVRASEAEIRYPDGVPGALPKP